ncbi:hypothetical protein [uncultured Algibacter sp.]|uniref:hypothetical protein n=1 Tax=uncultured Algibacter sp. TaxID=298659 RepID=UPI002623D3DB|nr:hypothetical protein [uncultured Algibacter sp.]
MKKINLLFIALVLVLTSCSSDDSKSEVILQNKLVLNGEEYEISKVISYFETNGEPADFYYFDLAFLSKGMDFSFSSGETYVDGTGSILAFSLISETAPIENGDYLHTKNSIEFAPFYVHEPYALINQTFNNQDWYDDFDNSVEYTYEDTFSNATINVVKNGDEYTISGSGTFNSVSFSLEYKGEIAFDPESDDI